MGVDGGELIQGGGLLAFVVVVYRLLRDHVARIETVLAQLAENSKAQAVADTRTAGALERLERRVGALYVRADRRKPQDVTGQPAPAHGFLDVDGLLDPLGQTLDETG